MRKPKFFYKPLLIAFVLIILTSVTTAVTQAQDITITLQFTETTSTASEGDERAVSISAIIEGGNATGTYSLDLAINDISTTSGEDYVTPLATYTVNCSPFCPSGSFVDLALTLIDDTEVEDAEQVEFTISNPQGEGLQLGANTTHLLTIEDNDTDPQPVRLHPENGATLDASNAFDWPRFTFEAIAGIQWYQVWVGPSDYSTTAYNAWMAAGSVCDAGVCTVPVDIWLGNGTYEWWMTYWSPSLPALDSYWNMTPFTVDFTAPTGTYNPSQPTNVDSNVNALEWPRDTNALWYQIWLGTDDYSTTVYFDWADARDICDQTTCTLPLDAVLPLGDYAWWMEVWGPNGYITWGDTNANPYAFTVIDAG